MKKNTETLDPENLRVDMNIVLSPIMDYMQQAFSKTLYEVRIVSFDSEPISGDPILFMSTENNIRAELVVEVRYAGLFVFHFDFSEDGFGVAFMAPNEKSFMIERDLELIVSGESSMTIDIMKSEKKIHIVLLKGGLVASSLYESDFEFESSSLESAVRSVREFCESNICHFLDEDIVPQEYYFGKYVPGSKDHNPELSFLLTPENCEEVFTKYKTDKLIV